MNRNHWNIKAAALVPGPYLVLGAAHTGAQSWSAPLEARASDPVAMRWMTGTPPPPDKLIRFADGSRYSFPQTRWSFSNMRQFMPTRVVSRGSAAASEMPRAERADIDAVKFKPIGGGEPMTWAQSVCANYTDGILVLHKGRIGYLLYGH